MIDREYERLLHEVVGGTASPKDAARLEAWLATSEAGRQRRRELEALFAVLGAVPRVAPPAALREGVLAAVRVQSHVPGATKAPTFADSRGHSPQNARARSGHGSPTFPREAVMKSRNMVIFAALALVAVVAVAVIGGRIPPKSGLEGTIGGANRYRAGQIADLSLIHI